MVTEIYIKQEHRDSELLRLRKGMDGCGCSECQDFYQLIDLSVYGDRVERYSDVITIIAGRTGADLYDDQRDYWTKNDSIFICDGQGYAVAKNGATVCIGPVHDDGSPREDVYIALVSVSTAESDVTKIKDDVMVRDKPSEGFLLQPKKRGRPRKTGDDVSRMTAWRRPKLCRAWPAKRGRDAPTRPAAIVPCRSAGYLFLHCAPVLPIPRMS